MSENKLKADLSDLYNFPSIANLFSDPDLESLQEIKKKLNSNREKLDSIIRRSSIEESQKASKALEAIQITISFLENLEENYSNSQNK